MKRKRKGLRPPPPPPQNFSPLRAAPKNELPPPPPPHSATMFSRLRRDLEDELHLHARIQRQSVHADGRSGVLAGFAEQLDKELAGAVGDLRLLSERRVAADEHADADDADDRIER